MLLLFCIFPNFFTCRFLFIMKSDLVNVREDCSGITAKTIDPHFVDKVGPTYPRPLASGFPPSVIATVRVRIWSATTL